MPLFLTKNTLLSRSCIERLKTLPAHEETLSFITQTVTEFLKMKGGASEIQTETHLVKPLLKALGFTFEAKPKFYEDHVKGPDFALFGSDAERIGNTPRWGTPPYFEHVLSLLTIKRYGRNLEEGISGFYLEFENRIPLYQSLYLMRVSKAPWFILTNGRRWFIIRRPVANEKLLVEIDLEGAVTREDGDTLLLFHHLFSMIGLSRVLPTLLRDERDDLVTFLKDQRTALARLLSPAIGKQAGQRAVKALCNELFPPADDPEHRDMPTKREPSPRGKKTGKSALVKAFDQTDILTYLCTRGASSEIPDFERIITDLLGENRTKEHLLSLKLLDMTPGFGNMTVRLTEMVAYLSFLLPYREKHSFVVEWENDHLLHGFILGQVLYGIERSPLAFEVLQNSLYTRFGYVARNFKEGNPLLGMSMSDLEALAQGKSQAGLFLRHPREVTEKLRMILLTYFSLSDRIKEDAAIKNEMEVTIRQYTSRMKEVMDLLTATYFDDSLDRKKIKELLYALDGSETPWTMARGTDWYRRAAEVAKRKGFFHMEIEFPLLVNNLFDLIAVQPNLTYLWEEQVPEGDAVKAFIKRAVAFLKPEGALVLAGRFSASLLADLKKSRRFGIDAREGAIVVKKRL
jgi:hypothetical protein